ncbi:MAG: class I SAM-dependent methyltransferase [Flavobacteriaceae bacterium]
MESLDYDEVTAFHYAAFRPALHQKILAKCLKTGLKPDRGLDIGCGTGQSAIALAHYCDKVVGIEPSAEMISRAIAHSGVSYLEHQAEELPFPEEVFDVITFAGSWYYAKSQQLLNEVFRVIKPGGTIVIYDFEIALKKVLIALGITPKEIPELVYDHKVDFSGLENEALEFNTKKHEKIIISFKADQLSHLLLAQKDQYEMLQELLGSDQLFEKTRDQLELLSGTKEIEVPADLYYTVYQRSVL